MKNRENKWKRRINERMKEENRMKVLVSHHYVIRRRDEWNNEWIDDEIMNE